jgi:hypothetical protein
MKESHPGKKESLKKKMKERCEESGIEGNENATTKKESSTEF